MQGFLKSVIYTVHHPVHVYNILVSAISLLPGFENGFERHFYNLNSILKIFIFFELIEGQTFSIPVNSFKLGVM